MEDQKDLNIDPLSNLFEIMSIGYSLGRDLCDKRGRYPSRLDLDNLISYVSDERFDADCTEQADFQKKVNWSDEGYLNFIFVVKEGFCSKLYSKIYEYNGYMWDAKLFDHMIKIPKMLEPHDLRTIDGKIIGTMTYVPIVFCKELYIYRKIDEPCPRCGRMRFCCCFIDSVYCDKICGKCGIFNREWEKCDGCCATHEV